MWYNNNSNVDTKDIKEYRLERWSNRFQIQYFYVIKVIVIYIISRPTLFI